MSNYQQGKIYTIRCWADENSIYVGSTTQTLAQRISQHRAKSRITPNNKLYTKVNGNWEDWYIELYEECPCTNKEILRKREGEIIREIGNLNKEIAGRTSKEYYEENKENIISKQKIYREEHGLVKYQEYQEKNRDKKKLYAKEYRLLNKDVRDRKEYIKEYRLLNKDKIKEYKREYNKMYNSKIKSNLIIKDG